MNYKNKICIFTTSRADFGLLRHFINNISKQNKIKSFVIATGTHLEKKHGYTIREIEKENIKVHKKIKIFLDGDTPKKMSKSIAIGMIKYNKILEEINPDLVVVLGDRYELLPICYSSTFLNIPIAHFNGGETSEGSIDDVIRHCVTKMSHLHFVSTDIYKKKVLNMGEAPNRVFNIGSLSVENVNKSIIYKKEFVYKKLNIQNNKKFFLATYHPSTLDLKNSLIEIENLMKTLKMYKKFDIIFTGTNADTKSQSIKNIIMKYIKKSNHMKYFDSLGSNLYLSAMKYCECVIGNSSSGILESPTLKKPVINIGNRQKGRLKAKNIIDCKKNTLSIKKAIEKSLNAKFIKSLSTLRNPFGNGQTSKKSIKIIKKTNLKKLLIKKFYLVK